MPVNFLKAALKVEVDRNPTLWAMDWMVQLPYLSTSSRRRRASRIRY